jgi:hypothetical protein
VNERERWVLYECKDQGFYGSNNGLVLLKQSFNVLLQITDRERERESREL